MIVFKTGRKKRWTASHVWTPPAMEGVSGTSGAKISPVMSVTQLLRYRIMFVLRQYFDYRGYDNPFYHGQPKKPIEI